MPRLYPPAEPLPPGVERFSKEHHATVAELDRQTAEALIVQHHPGVAPAILRCWPPGEKPRGIALSCLLGIVAGRQEATPRY